jgi:DNA-binding MarR family transcriptional regulator
MLLLRDDRAGRGAPAAHRRPDPDDGRRALLELTDAGREHVLGARARREGWLNEASERELSADEQERLREAIALLRRIADA